MSPWGSGLIEGSRFLTKMSGFASRCGNSPLKGSWTRIVAINNIDALSGFMRAHDRDASKIQHTFFDQFMIPFSDTVSVYASASNFFVDLLASHFGFKIGSKIPPDFSLYFSIFHRRFTISWLKLSFLPQGVVLSPITSQTVPKKPCVFFANPEPPHRLISYMYHVSIFF